MKCDLISPQNFKQQAWKNGQGTTKELAISAETPFHWRLSQAEIRQDGPFSDFPGYDRHLMLLEGRGVDLRHEHHADQILIQPYEHVTFGGDWQTQARLVAGPISDLNLMTLKNQCTGNLNTIRNADFDHRSDVLLIFAPKTAFKVVYEGGTIEVPTGHLLHCQEPLPILIDGGPAILATIRYS